MHRGPIWEPAPVLRWFQARIVLTGTDGIASGVLPSIAGMDKLGLYEPSAGPEVLSITQLN